MLQNIEATNGAFAVLPLLTLLLIRAIFLAAVIFYGPFSLGPDEAQYWTWSQELSYGYYSKPPGIAWQIFGSTALFGNTEWGVRSSALLIGTLLPIALYFAALKGGYGKKVAFWAGVAMALTPVDLIGSILAITDGGMLLFWTIALGVFLEALVRNTPPSPWLLGGMIALGALFKWPIYILLFVIVVFSMVYLPTWKKPLFKATGVSLLGLIPSLLWNLSHNFATFRHVGSTLVGGNETSGVSKANFLDFIGAQAVLLSPLLFFFFCYAVYRMVKRERTPSIQTYFLFILSMTLIIPVMMSLFEKMQGNWAVFIFPSAILFTVDDLLDRKCKGWLIASLALSAALTFSFFAFSNAIPFKMNPFKNTLGWRGLKGALDEVGYDSSKDTLVAETYQMTSLLSFYGKDQSRAYFVNLTRRRHNQFDFWSPLEKDPRKQGIFVAANGNVEAMAEKLRTRFSEVTFLRNVPLVESGGKVVQSANLFRVKGYEPKDEDVGLF